MSKTKELIICGVAIIVLILSISTNIFATSIDDLLGNMNNQNYQTIPDGTGTNSAIIDDSNTNTSNVTQNNALATIVSNNSANNNTTNTIPYTGVNSFSIIAIIAVCGVVAVYAYKKIRDYKI